MDYRMKDMNAKRRIKYLEEQIENLRNRIDEVLTTPYSYTLKGVDWYISDGEADIKGTFASTATVYEYRMSMEYFMVEEGPVLACDIGFADEDGRLDNITGKGDAFRVIATVIRMTHELVTHTPLIEDFMRIIIAKKEDQHFNSPSKIEVITFFGNPQEPSRVKLYERIVKNIPDYKLILKRDGEFVLLSNRVSNVKEKQILTFLRGR